MPVELQAGVTTFVIANEGDQPHSFVISGEGIHADLAEELPPGETVTLTIALNLGIYDAWCPIDDHEERGMHLSIQVTDPQVAP